MESRERFIAKRLRKNNLTHYYSIFNVENSNLNDLFNKCRAEISKKFGNKYGDNLQLENITISCQGDDYYSSVNLDINILETNEDRDIRVKKEILTLEGLYDGFKQQEKDNKNAKIRREKEEFLRLKKKYGEKL